MWGRAALAGIAELLRVELPEIAPYEETPTGRAPAYESLVQMLAGLKQSAGEDEARRYEIDRPHRLALALQRADALAPRFDGDDLEEIGELLGRPFSDLTEADAALERYVLEAGPERDADLLRYFYRRTLRAHELQRPALFEYVDRPPQPVA